MHQTNPGVGLVKREDLKRKLHTMYADQDDPETAARIFLEDIGQHTALLLARGPEEYGFIHLTFEEYLSAVALALQAQGDANAILHYLSPRVGEQAWREVALLTVGYVGIRQQLPGVAGRVVTGLLEQQPGAPGEAVVLAGEAVLDALPGGVPDAVKTATIQALLPTMQNIEVAPELRRKAGLLLGRFGWMPDDLDDWVPIPAGDYLYGDEKEPARIAYPYWIAKYPVTNLQYQRFVDAGGYTNDDFWSDAGQKWREAENRSGPSDYNQDTINPLVPRVGVSWYEAEAYANWLNTQPLSIDVPPGYRVRLATEQEWERAARGPNGRAYPWGETPSTEHANYDNEAKGTTAVCTYPTGKSLEGVWDMSGNVWEWTHSWYDKDKDARVLRGGAFDYNGGYVRSASRIRSAPSNFYDAVGFRMVLSLADSES